MLRAAPNLRVIASSRETLRVPGEHAYPILPLPLPSRGDSAEALAKSTAVRLFVARAKSHKPAFDLTEREAPAVAELVARLEGIPLALELAAARVRLLSVADINARLKDRFKLLTGGDRTLQKRQQTLRALVDWSYDLLNDNEKCVLGRLGVFVGGFDLAAAEAVCGADPVDPIDVLDLIGSMVEKSLVMAQEKDEGTRYRMLETIREYALEKLVGRGEETEVATRHCDFYFSFAKAGRDGLRGAEQAIWTRRMETEIDNLRSATALALSGAVDPLIAVKLAIALAQFWMLRGMATEGRGVVRAALALPQVQESDLARAWALYIGAGLAGSQGDYREARRLLEDCLELRRRLGNPREIAATLSTLALYRLHLGDVAASAESEQEALRMFRELGDKTGEAIGMLHLGQIAFHEGNDERARIEFEASSALARELAYQEVVAETELLLGVVELATGDRHEAVTRFGNSLSICREDGDRRGEANAQRWLGKADVQLGELASARQRLGGALRAFQEFEMREELVACLEDHVQLAYGEGRVERAISLASAAEQARRRLALSRTPRDQRRWAETLQTLRASDARFESAWELAEQWETREAVQAALELPKAISVGR